MGKRLHGGGDLTVCKWLRHECISAISERDFKGLRAGLWLLALTSADLFRVGRPVTATALRVHLASAA